jgi:Mg/Co/Ni transporter MgtE
LAGDRKRRSQKPLSRQEMEVRRILERAREYLRQKQKATHIYVVDPDAAPSARAIV